MHRKTRLASVTGIFLCILLVACAAGIHATKIELKRYAPAFKADLSEYKGKRIYLMNFDNQARDTSVWYYFSPDKKFAYGGDSLIHNYFWYSFAKALIHLSMIVSTTDLPDPGAPAMWLTLKSVTDEAFTVEVKILMPFFLKTYTVVEETPEQGERTVANLEKRAYRMTDKLVEAVLTDPEFKTAYFRSLDERARPPIR